MANKIKAKLVLKLRAAGHSRNSIAKSQKMAKASVIAVFDAADELGIAYEDVEGKDDGEVYAMLFPGEFSKESVFDEPDWDYVHRELGKTGVTLDLLHEEYAEGVRRERGRGHVLHHVLAAVRRLLRVAQLRDVAHRAQGGPLGRGRLVVTSKDW